MTLKNLLQAEGLEEVFFSHPFERRFLAAYRNNGP